MTNKPEFKPCEDAVEALEQAMYNANQWHADTQYKAGSKDVAEVCIELLSQSGYTITRAEPAAPSSDENVAIYAKNIEEAINEHENFLNEGAAANAAKLYSLQEGYKRLREALTKYATADVTCSYIEVPSRADEVHEHCEMGASSPRADKRR